MIPRTSRQIDGGVVRSYYLINGFKMMYFAVAIFYTFFLELGLTFGQIALLYVAYGTSSMLINLPAPTLTDKFGKKNISILGFTMLTIAIFEIGIANSFFTIVLAFLMWGSADSLIYVAFESLFYENLQYLGIEDRYVNIRSNSTSISMGFLIISSITGPLLFMINSKLPWLLFGLALSISMVLMYRYPEFKTKGSSTPSSIELKKYTEKNSQTTILLRDNIKWVMENSEIRKLMLILLVSTLSYSLFVENIEEPLLIKFGFSANALGIIYAVTRGTTGLILPKIGRISNKIGEKSILAISLALVMVSYSLMLLGIPSILFVLISIAIILSVNMNSLILEERFQTALDPNRRTVFMSLLNMVSMSISNLGTFISSLVIEKTGFDHYLRSATLVILIALSSGILLLYTNPNSREVLIKNLEISNRSFVSNFRRNKDPLVIINKETWYYTKSIDSFKEKRNFNHSRL